MWACGRVQVAQDKKCLRKNKTILNTGTNIPILRILDECCGLYVHSANNKILTRLLLALPSSVALVLTGLVSA